MQENVHIFHMLLGLAGNMRNGRHDIFDQHRHVIYLAFSNVTIYHYVNNLPLFFGISQTSLMLPFRKNYPGKADFTRKLLQIFCGIPNGRKNQ
jgi:hypothetical protein